MNKASGSATPIINRSKWEELLIPVPSGSEQNKIVIKVEELMAICEQLKSNINQAQQTQINLTDALAKKTV